MKPALITFGAVVLLSLLLIWAQNNHIILITIDNEKPLDAATLMLLAATLVVTGVGVIIAFIAFFERRQIRLHARRIAREAATHVAAIVARETAESVAARTVLESQPSGTTTNEAAELVRGLEVRAQRRRRRRRRR